MPAVFQDVVRDLIANARKYTPPGGKIIAGLYQDDEELRFVVADTGRRVRFNQSLLHYKKTERPDVDR
jgi:signal transduction histidine kinase